MSEHLVTGREGHCRDSGTQNLHQTTDRTTEPGGQSLFPPTTMWLFLFWVNICKSLKMHKGYEK